MHEDVNWHNKFYLKVCSCFSLSTVRTLVFPSLDPGGFPRTRTFLCDPDSLSVSVKGEGRENKILIKNLTQLFINSRYDETNCVTLKVLKRWKAFDRQKVFNLESSFFSHLKFMCHHVNKPTGAALSSLSPDMEPNSLELLLLPELLFVLFVVVVVVVVVVTTWLLPSRKSIAVVSTSDWANLSSASLSILQNSVLPSRNANSSPGMKSKFHLKPQVRILMCTLNYLESNDVNMPCIESTPNGKSLTSLSSQSHFCWTNIHIYHIWCRISERNLAYNKFCHHARNMCNFHLRIADTLGTLNTQHATRDPELLVKCTDQGFDHHNPRNASNFVSLLGLKENWNWSIN